MRNLAKLIRQIINPNLKLIKYRSIKLKKKKLSNKKDQKKKVAHNVLKQNIQ
jgi:hypothetical protein